MEILDRGHVSRYSRLLIVMDETTTRHQLQYQVPRLRPDPDLRSHGPIPYTLLSFTQVFHFPKQFSWVLSPTEPNAKESTRRASSSLFPDPEYVRRGAKTGGRGVQAEGPDTRDRAGSSRAVRSTLHEVPQQLVVAVDDIFGSEHDIENICPALSDLSF